MADNILAVDVGADSIKVAEFSYPGNGVIQLEDFSFREYSTENEDDMLDSLCSELNQILLEPRFLAKDVNLCISGQLAFIKFVKLPPVSDAARLQQAIEFEAKENIPFPIDEVVWSYQIIESGPGAEPEAMFVVVKKNYIERITAAVESAGRHTALVDVASAAGYNAARLNGVGQDECVMLLNIGGRCSTLSFIENERFYTRSIPIAGHYITEHIAKEFDIDYKDAEDMKRHIGFVALGGAYEAPESQTADQVSKIIRNTMTRLHGEINRSINVYRSQQGGERPVRLILAGGSSIIPFTPRFFNEKLRIDVDYFNPFDVVMLAPHINKEALAEVAHLFTDVVGVGMRNVTDCPVSISLMPENLKKKNEVKAKLPFLYASAAVLLFGAALIFGSTLNQMSFFEKSRSEYEAKIREIQVLSAEIKNAQDDLTVARKAYDEVVLPLKNRDRWVGILSEIQQLLPDNAWLAEFSGEVEAIDPYGVREVRSAGAPEQMTLVVEAWNGKNATEPLSGKLAEKIKSSKNFPEFKDADDIKVTKDMDNLSYVNCKITLKPVEPPAPANPKKK